ncbi:MAG: hypothetical protein MJ213_03965 [Bacilli bacterium]|nr:hypothetical protein [Bacilli bacterium]
MNNENNKPQQKEATKKPNKFKAIFKNKIFWICFGVVLLGGIIAWCAVAPGDTQKILNIKVCVARLIGLFCILTLGLLLGRVTIKGISFGSAGVFLVALLIGAIFALPSIRNADWIKQFALEKSDIEIYNDAFGNLGLALFATAVGFIAGPTFFRSFKTNAKIYITMGIAVTFIGVVITALIGLLPLTGNAKLNPFLASGIFSGAITSTPALAAAKEVAGTGDAATLVTIGYAVTYPLGVLGVVLFIQLMPKILKADMSMERGLLIVKALKQEMNEEKDEAKRSAEGIVKKEYFKIDEYGLTPFAIAVFFGMIIGAINIPLTPDGFGGPAFSLGTVGGCLLMSIIFGHFGHIGKMSFEVPAPTNKTFREFGLIVFLAGIGVGGGYDLVYQITNDTGLITGPIIAYSILLGLVITIVPMFIGYVMGKKLFKLPLLNNLGAITGSMTSTPALGALIGMAKTDDVAIAYASAFPIATILTAVAMTFYLQLATI